MKQIRDSFHQRTQSLHEQVRAKRQELRQASEGGTFNEALATQKLTETASLRAKLMGEQFKMRQEMLSVLTAEQKAQIEQKRAEFKAKEANRQTTSITTLTLKGRGVEISRGRHPINHNGAFCRRGTKRTQTELARKRVKVKSCLRRDYKKSTVPESFVASRFFRRGARGKAAQEGF